MPRAYEEGWIERTHRLAVRVLRIVAKLPRTPAGFHTAGNLTRCSQSVVYNLEEAKASLTQPETLSKTAISRREAAETRRALMIIRDAALLPPQDDAELEDLIGEYNEVVAMLTSGTMRLQQRIRLKTLK